MGQFQAPFVLWALCAIKDIYHGELLKRYYLPEEFRMAKKVQFHVKLQVAAGMANPSPPPVGPALGQQGCVNNIMNSAKRSTQNWIPSVLSADSGCYYRLR